MKGLHRQSASLLQGNLRNLIFLDINSSNLSKHKKGYMRHFSILIKIEQAVFLLKTLFTSNYVCKVHSLLVEAALIIM